MIKNNLVRITIMLVLLSLMTIVVSNKIFAKDNIVKNFKQQPTADFSIGYFSNIFESDEWSGYVCDDTVTDFDGNVYSTIKIGRQCWMRQNLRVGTMINSSANQTDKGVIQKYCYNNISDYCQSYGGLYQWAEAVQYLNGATNTTSWNPVPTGNVQGICPFGWHIPSNNDLTILVNYLAVEGQGGVGSATAGKLKEAGIRHWVQEVCGNSNCNSSGFTALPAGYRNIDGGTTIYLGGVNFLWSTTEFSPTSSWLLHIPSGDYLVQRPAYNKAYGFSVRCLKD